MLKKLLFYKKKYKFEAKDIAVISGHSEASINSYIIGRRNVQEKLIKFLDLYDKHEELKKQFNNDLLKINDEYHQLMDEHVNEILDNTHKYKLNEGKLFNKNKHSIFTK